MYLDSVENAIDSLDNIIYLLNRKSNLKWKWIIIALHHSLYNFSICNIEGSNYQFNVLKQKGNNEDEGRFVRFGNHNFKKSKIKKRGFGYLIEWVEATEGEVKQFENMKPRSVEFNKKEYIIGFWTVLARIQDSYYWMKRSTISKAVEITDEEWESITLLNEYRNSFMHYIPMGWTIDINDFKKIVKNVLNVIEKVALNTRQIMYYDFDSRNKVEEIINEIKKQL